MKYLVTQHNNKKWIVAMRRVLGNGLCTQLNGVKYQILSSFDDADGIYVHPTSAYSDNNGTTLTRIKAKFFLTGNLLYRAPAVFSYNFYYATNPYSHDGKIETHYVVLWNKDLVTNDDWSIVRNITFDNINGVYIGRGAADYGYIDGFYSINGNKWVAFTDNSFEKILHDIGTSAIDNPDYDYFSMVLNNDGSINYMYQKAVYDITQGYSRLYYCEYHIDYIGAPEQVTSNKGSKMVRRGSQYVEPLLDAGHTPASSDRYTFNNEKIIEQQNEWYLQRLSDQQLIKIPNKNVVYEPISQRYYTLADFNPVKSYSGTKNTKLGLFYCTGEPKASLDDWTLGQVCQDMTSIHLSGIFNGYNVDSFNCFL